VRRAVARVDLDAISQNVARLSGVLQGGAQMCAVVKANAYGHGAAECAGAALRGGATSLAVATAGEAAALRPAVGDVPILVMGSVAGEEIGQALASRGEISIWRDASRELLGSVAEELGVVPRVHVKHDSGMGRLGLRDRPEVAALIDAVAADERMDLAGVWTHFATADDDDEAVMREQLERFRAVAEPARERHPEITLHAANSAATLRDPATHFDMVRCGVAIYGLDPFGHDPRDHGLEPALELRSYVADVTR
jgi:alanine racemase